MRLAEFLPVVTALAPVGWAWWTHRRTALVHAATWGVFAWLAWVAEAVLQTGWSRYLAVALTACTGVAVFGARRPGAAAWNAVVAGLLAVFLLPIGRQFFLSDRQPIDSIWLWLLGIVIGVVCVNYVPTALRWPAAITFLLCFGHIGYVNRGPSPKDEGLVEFFGGFVPWFAWLCIFRRRSSADDPAQVWLRFRDRFGAVWATRVLLQFNAAAKNARLKTQLRLDGFRDDSGQRLSEVGDDARKLLLSLLQRFDWS